MFSCRYDFVPPVQYSYLNDDEAEERFEKRNNTLNYFSIMVSKRIREKEGKESAEPEEKTKSGKKKGNLVRLFSMQCAHVNVCVCVCVCVCSK